jgi:hypothetical protein
VKLLSNANCLNALFRVRLDINDWPSANSAINIKKERIKNGNALSKNLSVEVDPLRAIKIRKIPADAPKL